MIIIMTLVWEIAYWVMDITSLSHLKSVGIDRDSIVALHTGAPVPYTVNIFGLVNALSALLTYTYMS